MTGPGSPMETEEKVIFGRRLTVWKHVSDSLLLFISFVFRDIAPAMVTRQYFLALIRS